MGRTSEHLELPLRRPEPFDGFTFRNNGELALGIGLKLLSRVKAPLETAKKVPGHIALVRRRDAEIERRLAGCGHVGARSKRGEASADHDFVVDPRLLPKMRLHLSVDEASDLFLAEA